MALHVKIVNNEIEHAPLNYKNVVNFNSNVEEMEKEGYYPLVSSDAPEYDESYQKLEHGYKLIDNKVVEQWTVTDYRTKEEAEEEARQKEEEHIGSLTCTKRVFALILQKLGIDYLTQLKPLIESDPQAQLEWELSSSLLRSNPLLNTFGEKLGLTSALIDLLFKVANEEVPMDSLMSVMPKREESTDDEPIEDETVEEEPES